MDFLNIIVEYFSSVPAQWNELMDNFSKYLPILGVIVIIESLLSVDNAAVLATLVMDLPKEQRNRALKYGILGAYFFRGLCLILAGFLVTIFWLKPLGGVYLLWLVWKWWKGKQTPEKEDDFVDKRGNLIYRMTVGTIGNFWATVALVEIMDLAFSIDNVFAVVAFTPNIVVIWIGVFVGILAMRFVAQGFVRLMEKYTFLETCAFIVIAILGIKLMLSGYTYFYPCSGFTIFMEGDRECLHQQGHDISSVGHQMAKGDLITSLLTVAIFVVPILTSILFNYPKREVRES
jgi:YkoY family integral membrane protein